MGAEGFSEALGCDGRIFLGAAGGLRDDAVDQLELEEVLGGESEGGGGLLAFAGVPVDDGGAAFRGDDAVNGVLQHQNGVADAEGQGAAAAAFAYTDDDHGDGEAGHLPEIAGDGFGLAALLGVDAGGSTGGIE